MNIQYQNSFKDILKDLRLEKGLGQSDLAKKLQCSKSIISMWENGKREPSMHCIIKIADFFDITTDYLLGRTD